MNGSPNLSFAIQNRVFGLQGDQTRWSRLKSCGSKSAVTRYLREWILPLGQNDNYRIEVSSRSGNGEKTKQVLSIESWFGSR